MRLYFAECLGTFALVFAGCGAIVVNDLYPGTLGHVGVSVVFGLIVMAMIYAVGNISGAHLNPAVSLGFCAAGRLTCGEAIRYVVSQLIGAVAGAALLRVIFVDHATLGSTVARAGLLPAGIMEVVLTFLLMFVILNVSTGHYEKGIMAGVAVGGTVALAALVGGPVSGASLNPARSLGPALVSGQLADLWLYLVAPCGGALLAAPMCKLIQGPACCVADGSAATDGC
ncbi:MAG: aquaporin [Verrucomicrobia bacterium]|nr:aquaporin [Verrucomicrobiota bacterium]